MTAYARAEAIFVKHFYRGGFLSGGIAGSLLTAGYCTLRDYPREEYDTKLQKIWDPIFEERYKLAEEAAAQEEKTNKKNKKDGNGSSETSSAPATTTTLPTYFPIDVPENLRPAELTSEEVQTLYWRQLRDGALYGSALFAFCAGYTLCLESRVRAHLTRTLVKSQFTKNAAAGTTSFERTYPKKDQIVQILKDDPYYGAKMGVRIPTEMAMAIPLTLFGVPAAIFGPIAFVQEELSLMVLSNFFTYVCMVMAIPFWTAPFALGPSAPITYPVGMKVFSDAVKEVLEDMEGFNEDEEGKEETHGIQEGKG